MQEILTPITNGIKLGLDYINEFFNHGTYLYPRHEKSLKLLPPAEKILEAHYPIWKMSYQNLPDLRDGLFEDSLEYQEASTLAAQMLYTAVNEKQWLGLAMSDYAREETIRKAAVKLNFNKNQFETFYERGLAVLLSRTQARPKEHNGRLYAIPTINFTKYITQRVSKIGVHQYPEGLKNRIIV